jgi:hypothetical protein
MAWPAGSRFHYLYERERAVMPELLGRRRILIVEDDWMVAEDMSYMVEELGGAVVGPAGQLAQGLALAESEQLAGAILDVNLNGENTFVLADRPTVLVEANYTHRQNSCCTAARLSVGISTP